MVRLRIIFSKVALQKRGSMEPMEPPLDPPLVNRGGYGLEVPCVYRLYGPKVYVEKMRELVNSLRTAGLL